MAQTRTSFTKGKTGNPGGRPKGAFAARDLARKHTKAAIDKLFAIMQKGTSEQAQIGAAVALLDRGWGKAIQPHTGEDSGDIRVVIRQIIDVTGQAAPVLIGHDDGCDKD